MTAALLVLAMTLASVGDIDPAPTVHREPPRPAQSVSGHSVRGIASWFATGPDGLYAAAGPALRKALGDWRGKIVKTCLSNSPATCIRVKLSDYCACPGRLIDLSDQAFRRLAPLSVGLITARVSW